MKSRSSHSSRLCWKTESVELIILQQANNDVEPDKTRTLHFASL